MGIAAGKSSLLYAILQKESELQMFPRVVEEWDLHVLYVDSIRASMAETYPKSSLMESFVPVGGFFSMPSDIDIRKFVDWTCDETIIKFLLGVLLHADTAIVRLPDQPGFTERENNKQRWFYAFKHTNSNAVRGCMNLQEKCGTDSSASRDTDGDARPANTSSHKALAVSLAAKKKSGLELASARLLRIGWNVVDVFTASSSSGCVLISCHVCWDWYVERPVVSVKFNEPVLVAGETFCLQQKRDQAKLQRS
ncbi:hypothetical protein Tco_0409564 [Tanacetum coccineum]